MPNVSPLQNKELLKEALDASDSISETLQYLGLRAAGGNYKALHLACNKHNLTPKIGTGTVAQIGNAIKANTKPLSEILVQNSSFDRGNLKKKLLKLGLLNEVCYICGLGPIWNGKPISLQLDHINGVYNDHRIENLRILCPNCHSQTDTFAGRKRSLRESKIDRRTIKRDRPEKRKFEVSKGELSDLISNYSRVAIGRKFDVSDSAIRKRAKKFGLL